MPIPKIKGNSVIPVVILTPWKEYRARPKPNCWVTLIEFKKIYPEFDLLNIDEDKIIVTIEKNKIGFELFYYAKILNNSLKKIEILEDNKLKISNKDPKGFTASETKFMKYIWKPHHKLTGNGIININLFCNMRG